MLFITQLLPVILFVSDKPDNLLILPYLLSMMFTLPLCQNEAY